MSDLTNIAVSQLLNDRFLQDFHRNNDSIVGNISVKSADFENLDQGHRLQKSLYIYMCMTDCNQTFTKMMQLRLATKA